MIPRFAVAYNPFFSISLRDFRVNIVYTYESILRPHSDGSTVPRANLLPPILIINKRTNERTKLAFSAVSRAGATQLLGHSDKFETGSSGGHRYPGAVFTRLVDDRVCQVERFSEGARGQSQLFARVS